MISSCCVGSGVSFFHLFCLYLKKHVVTHSTNRRLVVSWRCDFFLIQFEYGGMNLNCPGPGEGRIVNCGSLASQQWPALRLWEPRSGSKWPLGFFEPGVARRVFFFLSRCLSQTMFATRAFLF